MTKNSQQEKPKREGTKTQQFVAHTHGKNTSNLLLFDSQLQIVPSVANSQPWKGRLLLNSIWGQLYNYNH